MASCKHNMGSYRAEAITVTDGKGRQTTQYHYRCNGCDIILSTR
jgi:hypothetical protein